MTILHSQRCCLVIFMHYRHLLEIMNVTQLFIISIAVLFVHNVLAEDHPEECETLPSELHIIKGKFYRIILN